MNPKLSIDDHAEARARIAADLARAYGEPLDDIEADFPVVNPTEMRSEKETNRVLSILDELERREG